MNEENKLSIGKETYHGRKRIEILGVSIDALSMQETVELVEKYVIGKVPLHLIGVNADKINEIYRNGRLKKIVAGCEIVNADGASVVLAGRFLGCPVPERVAGIDLMLQLISLCTKKGYSIYLLGAKQEIVEKTAENLKICYPGLKIAGIHNGYFQQSEWPEVSEIIREKEPDIVFVGITSPLKEYLIEYLQDKGNNCVFMGVGGSFDVLSGTIPRAPQWMQKWNLEWLFRVVQEPRRLFGRYFIGNFIFITRIAGEKIKRKDSRRNRNLAGKV